MKIICYNIHKGMDSYNKITLHKIISYLKSLDADFICLQEVLYSQFIIMKSCLKKKGVFAANVNNEKMKFGVCIFSKYNIEKSDHVFLTSKKEQRGFLCITSNINDNVKINIINTHLGLDKDERANQIDEILEYIDGLDEKNILCGDFNEKNICISDLIDSAVYLEKYNPTYKTARIDYIFCSKNCIPEDFFVNVINLSDHFPIISIIKT
ncbi:MAG: endonuclease/exonuclease/phosphatase family protein [Terrisporobacter sp.]|uniref:endonuclease/exonuclease/phosphatase family protein n=1 Tax=Terrisporobacter sp. TaxID=1965305 RepID=UPI002FC6C5A1